MEFKLIWLCWTSISDMGKCIPIAWQESLVKGVVPLGPWDVLLYIYRGTSKEEFNCSLSLSFMGVVNLELISII